MGKYFVLQLMKSKTRRWTAMTTYASIMLVGSVFVLLTLFYGSEGIWTLGITFIMIGFIAMLMFWNTSAAVGELKQQMVANAKEQKERDERYAKEQKERDERYAKEQKERDERYAKEQKEQMSKNTETTNVILVQILGELKRLGNN